jgi:hypothetical protein
LRRRPNSDFVQWCIAVEGGHDDAFLSGEEGIHAFWESRQRRQRQTSQPPGSPTPSWLGRPVVTTALENEPPHVCAVEQIPGLS